MLSYRETYARPRAPHVGTGRFRLHVCFGGGQSFKSADGSRQTDFFNIVVWRQQGDNCARYLQKGSQCAVEGSIQNRSYEKDGEKRYITEIVADRVEFLGRPAQGAGSGSGGSGYDEFGRKEAIEDLPSVEDDTELPF